MFRQKQAQIYYTRNGHAVVFHRHELTIDQLNNLPPTWMLVEPMVSNNIAQFTYHIKLSNGSRYRGKFDTIKSVKDWPCFRRVEYSPSQEYKPYKNWSDNDFRAVSEVVEERARLLSVNRQIKIIDSQYIDYFKLRQKVKIADNDGYQLLTNDEWVKVRDAFKVVELIAELEEDYLQTQQLNLKIVEELLKEDHILEPEKNKADVTFWKSLRHRLQHLLVHPEDVTIFKVVAPIHDESIASLEYVNPEAVAALVRSSAGIDADDCMSCSVSPRMM